MRENKSRVKKRSRTFITLYYWGKFLGINPLNLLENNKLEFSYFSLFYSCFLLIIYCYLYYRIQIERMTLALSGETPISKIVNIIWRSSVLLQTTIIWLIFGFRQNQIKLIIKSFMRAQKISTKLGIPENYETCWRKLGIYQLLINTCHIIDVTFTAMILANIQNYSPLIWTCYSMLRITLFNMLAVFVWCLVMIRHKFRRLNEKMRLLMQNNITTSRQVDNELRDRLTNLRIANLSCNKILLADKINMISQLHRELRDLIRRIEEFSALPILLNMARELSSLPLNVYLFYRYLEVHETLRTIDFLFLGVIVYWIVYPMVLLIIISNVCGSTLDEANKTGSVLHAMLNSCNNFCDTREAVKFKVFSLDLLQNQMTISPFGFFKLDHFLIYRIIAMATAYTVIMLQFYA